MAYSSAFLVAVFLITLPVLALVQLRASHPRLAVERRVSHQRMQEGEAFDVTVSVRNAGTTTLFLEVADELPGLFRLKEGASNVRRALARPGESVEHAYAVQTPVKGRYSLNAVRVRVEDPFGLVYHVHTFAHHAPVTVLPASERLRKVPGKTRFPRIFLGQQLVRAPGQGMEFFGLREYMPGDPLKEVNWKASARSKNLVVNQRERETVADVTIFLDAREIAGYGRADDNALLWSARATASLTVFFLQRMDRVRLAAYGADKLDALEPDGGERHFYRVMERLTDTQAGGKRPFADAVHDVFPRLHRKSPVVIVSSCIDDPSLVQGCGLLRAHEMEVLVVAVPARWHSDDADAQALIELERRATLADLRGAGTRVVEWDGEQPFASVLMEATLG